MAGRVLLLFATLLFAIGLAEAGLRIIGFEFPQFHERDDTVGLTLRPHARGWYTEEGRAYVEVNSAGMRDIERPRAKAPGTLRIAVTERSVYSSGIDLTYHVGAPEGWLTDVHLAVRLYHDAQVAEVMGYQHQIYRRPWYGGQDIPGRKPCEKRQINLFLNECLNHCRRKGCHVVAQGNLTTM